MVSRALSLARGTVAGSGTIGLERYRILGTGHGAVVVWFLRAESGGGCFII